MGEIDLSIKQWKALALAYPVYGRASEAAEKGEEWLPPHFVEFIDVAVPQIEALFKSALSYCPTTREKAGGKGRHGGRPPSGVLPPWRSAVPTAVDALLSFLFSLGDGRDVGNGACARAFSEGQTCPLRPLTFSEVQLLYLCHKGLAKADALAVELASFKEQVQQAALSLTAALGAPQLTSFSPPALSDRDGRRTLSTEGRPRTPHQQGHVSPSRSPPSTIAGRGTAPPPPPPPPPPHALSSPFPRPRELSYSEPSLPSSSSSYSAPSAVNSAVRGGEGKGSRDGGVPPHEPDTFSVSPRDGGKRNSPWLMQAVVCEECGEVGGELFRCRRCSCVKHEACGGPHPVSCAPVNGRDGSVEGLCRGCRKEINLSSGSSSSMHSSTSSEERRQVDAYFGRGGDGGSSTDSEDDDSSFIVRTSEDSDFSKEESEAGGVSGASEETPQSRASSTSTASLHKWGTFPNRAEERAARNPTQGDVERVARTRKPLRRRPMAPSSSSSPSPSSSDGIGEDGLATSDADARPTSTAVAPKRGWREPVHPGLSGRAAAAAPSSSPVPEKQRKKRRRKERRKG